MPPAPGQPQRHPDPRRIGLEVLNRLETSGLTLDHLLADAFQTYPEMEARDRSLCHALVYGVQRWRGRLDWVVAHFARQRPETLTPKLRNLLRLGVFQICHLDRVPPAAVVNTSVQLAKAMDAGRKAGFVNGLLRNVARHHLQVPLPDVEAAPDTYLAVRHALPRWLVRRWLKRFGYEETAALGEALTIQPPLTVRTNTLKGSREQLIEDLAEIATVTPSDYAPLGLRLTAVTQPPLSWPALEKGRCQVQDEAAQLVGDLLAPRPGDTVLDACAGLGGKTGHLGQMMAGRGRLIATDEVPLKLERLMVEMKRLGLTNVEARHLDASRADALAALPRFDRILLDAPCSGLGVLRRNPDIKWRRTSRDLLRYQERQQELLTALSTRLHPGGRLVYAVCSMEPEENVAVIDGFLNSQPDFDIDRSSDCLSPMAAELMDDRGMLATYPHRHGMDGFFMVALKRLR